jgi:pyruvate dehydrogenase E1 component alpha subunit/2-oxoisovalerate dehydrogenase E1 component alpha subunit
MASRAAPIRESPPVPAGLTRPQLLEIYRFLRLTRTLEERLSALYRQTKVIGGLYRSLGQEGESVAAAYALERGPHRDLLSPLIRNLGAMLVMGARPIEILRQYMAKAAGPTSGREMNVHFNDLERGFVGQISHLGDMIPVMAGITLACKLRGERRVGLVFIGDGATSTGTFHEGLNFAAVRQVPLVVIAEYNRWAYSTSPEKQFAVKDLADKARGYGIPAVTVDGNDVFAVYQATKAAVAQAREGAGVQFIEVKTYRRKGHAEHDDQHYVAPAELDWWAQQNDPVDRYVRQLLDHAWASERELREIDDRARAEIDQATDACVDEPLPVGDTALPGVYAHPSSAPRHWYRSL